MKETVCNVEKLHAKGKSSGAFKRTVEATGMKERTLKRILSVKEK